MDISFLKNVSIKNKLLFIVIVPILTMLVLAEIKVSELHKQSTRQNSLVELMSISVAASNLVHELQKERGASAGFTNSKGKKFQDILPKQRLSTNEKLENLQLVLSQINTTDFGKRYNTQLQKALDDLTKIENMRSKISDLALPLPKVVGYYTNMNAKFLNITAESLLVAEDPKILRNVSAYLYFMQSKERAGIERAVGSAGFGGGWNTILLDKFKSLILVQDTYMSVFLSYATEEQNNFYNKKTADPLITEVQKMRDIALKSADGVYSSAETISGEYWFKTITKKLIF